MNQTIKKCYEEFDKELAELSLPRRQHEKMQATATYFHQVCQDQNATAQKTIVQALEAKGKAEKELADLKAQHKTE